MEIVSVKYSEIALKGKNRYLFENKLIVNIKTSCNKKHIKVIKVRKERFRIILYLEASRDEIENALTKVFGIKSFSYIDEVKTDIDSILETAKQYMIKLKKEGTQSISFKTTRADKNFAIKSPDVNSMMGGIATDLGIKIDYKGATETIFVEINTNKTYIHTKRIDGPDGLPTGSTGKVLVLLSGGIDSPVAAHQIMKRGCHVDFIHFHTFDTNKEVLDTKMVKLVKLLNEYQTDSKLYTMPCKYFKTCTMDKIFYPSYKLVLFKHFIFKLADEIAKKDGYDAILTGDSLAQVASQTIENMRTTQINIDTLVFRPLLTYDKQDIVNLSIKIGTHNISIEEYKDCCSLLADNPSTKTQPEKLQKMLDAMEFDKIIEQSFNKLESYNIE